MSVNLERVITEITSQKSIFVISNHLNFHSHCHVNQAIKSGIISMVTGITHTDEVQRF